MPPDMFCNTFAGSPLDRASAHRREPGWLADRFDEPLTRIHAFWKGEPLLEAPARLASIDAGLAAALDADGDRRLFLGMAPAGHAVFALDLDGEIDPSAGVLEGRGTFHGLREAALDLAPDDAAVAAAARAVFAWRRGMRFCPTCGGALKTSDGGWKRVCTLCGQEHFPRTDPVVIMLPIRGDACLLGRQAAWAPGRFSALAGFMEPGETIEEACAREIAEECGLKTLNVRYHSSQPWPFPFNLMIGLFAEVAEGEARADQSELEDVRWITRNEIRQLLRDAPGAAITLPPPLAIARRLIAAWAEP